VPGSPAPEGSVSARVVPRQLPAGAGFFAGREAELKELDALLGQAGLADGGDGDGGLGGAVVISAVAGIAGVGNTALGVPAAQIPAADPNRPDPVLRVIASTTGAVSHGDAAGRMAAVEPLVRPPLAGTKHTWTCRLICPSTLDPRSPQADGL
jgi:hypothetical protein